MSLRIVFMGTPDFAVPCLARLLEDKHTVVGVITQPDKPRGRGYKLCPPAVKVLAMEKGLPVYQPESLRTGEAGELVARLAPELIVVVAYGKILPPDLLSIPPLGCINVHASLLPHLRGAAPIQWSVIHGDRISGVTTMYLSEGMDAGDVILKADTPIGAEESAGQLFERLSKMGADLLSQTVTLIEKGNAPRTPQNHGAATFAPMITKELARIDFQKPAKAVVNLVRGLCPAPGAHILTDGALLKVYEARGVAGYHGAPGELLDAKRFIVACGSGAVELLSVQPQGKNVMSGSAYLCGKNLTVGQKFTDA